MRFLQVHLSVPRGGADVAVSNIKLGLERCGHFCTVATHDVAATIMRGQFDLILIHSHSPENRQQYMDGIEAARGARVPHAIVAHDYGFFCHQTNLVMPNAGWKRCQVTRENPCSPGDHCHCRVTEPLMVNDLVNTDIVCFTESSANLFRSAGFERIHVIPHGVDTTAFTPRPRSGGNFRVLFTNAWGAKEIKGYLHWEWLKRYFHGRPEIIFTEMLGSTEHRLMPSFLTSGDVMLFLSIWEETFGLVVAESMACGTPVISYPIGVSPALLDAGNGILVETSNPRDVAAAIERMIAMTPAERATMGELARRTIVDGYTVERMAADYVGLAKELAR